MALRLRAGVGLWVLSWFPYAVLFGVRGGAGAAVWAIQILVGLLGLAMVGSVFAQLVPAVGWRRSPRLLLVIFRTGRVPDDVTSALASVAARKAEAPGEPQSLKQRMKAAPEQVEQWSEAVRQRYKAADVSLHVYEEDRDAFAAVLGSAIAYRLFIFAVAFVVTITAAVSLIAGTTGLGRVMGSAGVTGSLATQVETATKASTGQHLGLLASGLFLSLLAGRSLTKVLAACSAGAWKVGGRNAKASMRTMANVTGLVAMIFLAASLLNRLRNAFGIAVATGSIALNIFILGVGWFFVCASLPRATRDPGALLPGAALFGVVMTAVQWFMNYYLPYKVASASETMGTMGVAVAALGYLFLIGRLMAFTLVLDAVLWEHVGSVSEFAFGLPGLRRLPGRFPKLGVFFDLGARHDALEAGLADAAGAADVADSTDVAEDPDAAADIDADAGDAAGSPAGAKEVS